MRFGVRYLHLWCSAASRFAGGRRNTGEDPYIDDAIRTGNLRGFPAALSLSPRFCFHVALGAQEIRVMIIFLSLPGEGQLGKLQKEMSLFYFIYNRLILII